MMYLECGWEINIASVNLGTIMKYPVENGKRNTFLANAFDWSRFGGIKTQGKNVSITLFARWKQCDFVKII